jgi:hypothetical protein
MPQSTRLGTSSQTDLVEDGEDGSVVLGSQNGTLTGNGPIVGPPPIPPALPSAFDDDIVKALRTHWSNSSMTVSWTGSPVFYQIGDTPAASGSP